MAADPDQTPLFKFSKLERELGYRPPPPPLPKYDPKEEAPMWSAKREKYNLPIDKGPIPWSPVGTQPASSSHPDWRGVVRDKVIEIPMTEPYTSFANPQSPNYYFFDTPDYADPFKKLWFSAKFFSITGVVIASAKGAIDGSKFTVKNNIFLIRKVFAPWWLCGMAASLTVVTVANLRGKKDDFYNYVASGLVMGGLLGRKNHAVWFRFTALLLPLNVLMKYANENNSQLYPMRNPYPRQGSLVGYDGEHGLRSGDFRFGFRGTRGDPGRDTRVPY